MSKPPKMPSYLSVAEDYLLHPGDYVKNITVTIKFKQRCLKTYQTVRSDDPQAEPLGEYLRQLHKYVDRYLRSKYKPSHQSFAYTKDRNILMCVSEHLHSDTFLKTDISNFFGSIQLEKMIERVNRLKVSNRFREHLDNFIGACFYKEKPKKRLGKHPASAEPPVEIRPELPLGFVSSPTLSDLFLTDLDLEMQKDSRFTYTRYADDFLISASGPNALEVLAEAKAHLIALLTPLCLNLNEQKTHFFTLKEPGASIRFLGVNLVKTNGNENRITISDCYLRETSYLFAFWHKRWKAGKTNERETQALFSRIAFIRQISLASLQKLKRIIFVKTGYQGELTRDDAMKWDG